MKKRGLSKSFTDSDSDFSSDNIQPEKSTSNHKIFQNSRFWFYLRKFKKKLRDSYVMDMQSAFTRGVKEGKEAHEVNISLRQQYQLGYAQGMWNGLNRIINPSIPVAPSPFTPRFVVELLKEIREDFITMKKKVTVYCDKLGQTLKEGIFKVKLVHVESIAIKNILSIKAGRRKRKRLSFENAFSEIEQLDKMIKST
eukprot:TRINITY_DN175_c0_g1_i1.p1 TRINITY_DN175_c0_g1~~TRINITY_DN175_c0_g1_i1.p1  ORF type:complete len:197 (+),score=45.19 TRINITY_DN175_c0_g1_i1:216-806(+)